MGKFSQGLLDEKIIFQHLYILPGQTILDAGCGNGYMAKKFSEKVGKTGKVYAFDIEQYPIDRLREEMGANSNIDAMAVDIALRTPIKDISVDLVYLSTVFHIFSEHQISGFEREVKRILKPKARLAIVNMNKEDLPYGPPLEMRTSPEELRQKLCFTPLKHIAVADHFYMQLFVND